MDIEDGSSEKDQKEEEHSKDLLTIFYNQYQSASFPPFKI